MPSCVVCSLIKYYLLESLLSNSDFSWRSKSLMISLSCITLNFSYSVNAFSSACSCVIQPASGSNALSFSSIIELIHSSNQPLSLVYGLWHAVLLMLFTPKLEPFSMLFSLLTRRCYLVPMMCAPNNTISTNKIMRITILFVISNRWGKRYTFPIKP